MSDSEKGWFMVFYKPKDFKLVEKTLFRADTLEETIETFKNWRPTAIMIEVYKLEKVWGGKDAET